jgi:hypothetical protein
MALIPSVRTAQAINGQLVIAVMVVIGSPLQLAGLWTRRRKNTAQANTI